MNQQDHAAMQLILSLDPKRKKMIGWLTDTLEERGLFSFNPEVAKHNHTRSLVRRANEIAFKNHHVHLVQLTCFEMVNVDDDGNIVVDDVAVDGNGKVKVKRKKIQFYKTAAFAEPDEGISNLTYRRKAIGSLESRYQVVLEYLKGKFRGAERRYFNRQLALFDLDPVPT
jgi:hypothetical protein